MHNSFQCLKFVVCSSHLVLPVSLPEIAAAALKALARPVAASEGGLNEDICKGALCQPSTGHSSLLPGQ